MNFSKFRDDFPILKLNVRGKPLVYLDNAATTQKPKSVLDKEIFFYTQLNSNIHRGVHYLSEKATQEYEGARTLIKNFIGAKSDKEIIFTRGTTESINLIASSFGQKYVKAGDEIVISAMEHHSNIVPWQLLCEKTGAKLKVIPINIQGELILENLDSFLTEKTKLLSLAHVSNSLGTINPVKELIRRAHQKNIPVHIDGAQSVNHLPTDVQDLDCDFLSFSSHKLYGPTGVGVLYGKEKWLEEMPPYQGGGDMIRTVTFEKTTYNTLPFKFEAGTPNIAGVIAFGEAIKYVTDIGLNAIHEYENELLQYATQELQKISELKIIGQAKNKTSVISFSLGKIHPHDIGTIVDQEGVAIRTGHHCAQPVMDFFKVPATARASLAFYNNKSDIDRLVLAIQKVKEVFK